MSFVIIIIIIEHVLLTSSEALHATQLCIATPHKAGILRSKKQENRAVNHVQLPSVNKQCKWDRIHHLLLETQRLSALSHPTNQDAVRAQNEIGRIDKALFNSPTLSLSIAALADFFRGASQQWQLKENLKFPEQLMDARG